MTCHRTIWLALLGGFALLLVGCDVGIRGQDIEIRHDVESDSLELLIVTWGLYASGNLDKARDQLRSGLDGDRVIWIPRWGIHDNLDSGTEDEDPVTRAVRSSVDLVKSFLFEDENGELCVLQHFRFRDLGLALEWVNREWSRSVLEELAKAEEEEEEEEEEQEAERKDAGDPEGGKEAEEDNDEPSFDLESRAMWIAAAQRGHRWVDVREGRLMVRLPVTAATAHSFRDELIDDVMDDPASLTWIGQHLLYLEELEIGDRETRLVFSAPSDGVARFVARGKDVKYNDKLEKSLRAEGFVIEETPDPEALRLPRQ